jgi:hypothetical protein
MRLEGRVVTVEFGPFTAVLSFRIVRVVDDDAWNKENRENTWNRENRENTWKMENIGNRENTWNRENTRNRENREKTWNRENTQEQHIEQEEI